MNPKGTNSFWWTNKEVEGGNAEYLAALPGTAVHCNARRVLDHGAIAKCGEENVEDVYQKVRDRLHSATEVPVVVLKIGAKVIFTANVDVKSGVHNGRRGDVHSFLYVGDTRPNEVQGKSVGPVTNLTPIVVCDNGVIVAAEEFMFTEDVRDINGHYPKPAVKAGFACVPLRLAHCSTLSKCIGEEHENIMLMLTSAYLYENLAYIGLGRSTRGWAGLHLPLDFNIKSIRMNAACLDFAAALEQEMDALNVVQWRDPTSKSSTFAIMNSLYADINSKDIPRPNCTSYLHTNIHTSQNLP